MNLKEEEEKDFIELKSILFIYLSMYFCQEFVENFYQSFLNNEFKLTPPAARPRLFTQCITGIIINRWKNAKANCWIRNDLVAVAFSVANFSLCWFEFRLLLRPTTPVPLLATKDERRARVLGGMRAASLRVPFCFCCRSVNCPLEVAECLYFHFIPTHFASPQGSHFRVPLLPFRHPSPFSPF